MADVRVGLGFDVHPWADDGRDLWLGGIRFEGERGLAGHSDGDAVCHALADALLGAAVLGDVGQHFPDTEPSVAGIAGAELLTRTVSLVADAGHTPSSEIRRALAGATGLAVARVSVKATRPEGLGLVGDGIGCLAVATIT
jgi:2C-methyl-D-erythritol 2,4-cyclodiphosphate synthase